MRLLLILPVIMILACCREQQTPKTESTFLSYTILDEEEYETPGKAQIKWHILITDSLYGETELKELLNHLYAELINRKGFRYYSHPTSIYIYSYTSRAKYQSQMGMWVAWLAKNKGDQSPTIDINETQLNSLSLEPENKFGLTELQRQRIWDELILMEDSALRESQAKYPIDITHPRYKKENIDKSFDLNDILLEKYSTQLEEKHNLAIGILDSIAHEGQIEGWAFPKW